MDSSFYQAQIQGLRLDIENIKESLKISKNVLDIYETLFKEGAVSKVDYLEKKIALQNIELELNQANSRIQEIKAMKIRHESGQSVVKAWVDTAPAMGMIGTLIGLVLMLGNMADPKAIGPAMAVALLTTLYGAFIANVIFGPMLTKLENYTSYEVVYREMVVLGLRSISRGESPRDIQDIMAANLSPKVQEALEAA